jgi:DNA-binding MarR family transcriptional regulator
MENKSDFDEQVERFHQQIVEIIKRYQFRDRNQICCCGVSVSQCYVLEALHHIGDLTMKQLAEKMHLSISTVTRVVEQLVRKQYVERTEDSTDRRIRLIKITNKGQAAYERSWNNIFESEKTILENFPSDNREMLIDFLQQLNNAIANWRVYCHK